MITPIQLKTQCFPPVNPYYSWDIFDWQGTFTWGEAVGDTCEVLYYEIQTSNGDFFSPVYSSPFFPLDGPLLGLQIQMRTVCDCGDGSGGGGGGGPTTSAWVNVYQGQTYYCVAACPTPNGCSWAEEITQNAIENCTAEFGLYFTGGYYSQPIRWIRFTAPSTNVDFKLESFASECFGYDPEGFSCGVGLSGWDDFEVSVFESCGSSALLNWPNLNSNENVALSNLSPGNEYFISIQTNNFYYQNPPQVTSSNGVYAQPVLCWQSCISDFADPEFTFLPPDSVSVDCENLDSLVPPTATDDSGYAGVYFYDEPDSSGCTGSFIRHWIAADQCENEIEFLQTVTLLDTTPPVVSNIPLDFTISCSWPIPDPPDDIIVVDNCDEDIELELIESVVYAPPLWYIERKWEAIDQCNNPGSSSQFIHLTDTWPPAMNLLPDTTVYLEPGEIEYVVPDFEILVSPSDNCDFNPTYFQVPEAGTTLLPGVHFIQYFAQDFFGNSINANFDLTVEFSVGDAELSKSEFSIYPNPANESFMIELRAGLQGPLNISIIDVQGKLVHQFIATSNRTEVDVSMLEDGMYFLNLLNSQNGEVSIQKLSIVH